MHNPGTVWPGYVQSMGDMAIQQVTILRILERLKNSQYIVYSIPLQNWQTALLRHNFRFYYFMVVTVCENISLEQAIRKNALYPG